MPQRLAGRTERRFRSRGGQRLLWAVQRRLALRVKQSREDLHGFGVGRTAALAHRVEKLVHLLQGEQVVQRLQRVDRGHHGAAFESCSSDRSSTITAGHLSSSDAKRGVGTLPLSVHVGSSPHLCSFSQCHKTWQPFPFFNKPHKPLGNRNINSQREGTGYQWVSSPHWLIRPQKQRWNILIIWINVILCPRELISIFSPI